LINFICKDIKKQQKNFVIGAKVTTFAPIFAWQSVARRAKVLASMVAALKIKAKIIDYRRLCFERFSNMIFWRF